MHSFTEYSLYDLISIIIDNRGKTPCKLGGSFGDSGYRVLTAKNIKTGKILNLDNIRYISEDLYKKWMKYDLKHGDVLITSEAPFGELFYFNLDEKLVLGQRLYGLRFKDGINPLFVYYYMQTKIFQKELDKRATGTTVRGLRQKELLQCKVSLPSLDMQNKIADILSSIDNKIDTNTKISENLEKQAKAIFKSFCISFDRFKDEKFVESKLGLIPESFKTCSLGDVVTIIDNRGKTPNFVEQKTDYPLIDVKVLGGDMRIINYEKVRKYVDKVTYDNAFRAGHPKKYDILISTVGTLSELKLFIENKGCIAQNVVAIRAKDKLFALYLFEYLRSIKNEICSYDIGAVQPSIKVSHIIKKTILLPNERVIKSLNNILEPLTNSLFSLNQEKLSLIELKNNLLTKLMSGDIEIKN